MVYRNGDGWVAIDHGRVVTTGSTAMITKDRNHRTRNGACPYCESNDVDRQRGWNECRDCGKTWSA